MSDFRDPDRANSGRSSDPLLVWNGAERAGVSSPPSLRASRPRLENTLLLSSLSGESPPPYTAVESESPTTAADDTPTGASTATDLNTNRRARASTLPCNAVPLVSHATAQVDGGDTDTASVSSLDLVLPDESIARTQKRMRRASAIVEDRPSAASVTSPLAAIVPSFLSRKSYVSAVEAKKAEEQRTDSVEALEPLPAAFMVLLHSLRLFATVPGIIGTILCFRRGCAQLAVHYRWFRTMEDMRTPGALEYFICCFWALCTAFHALSLMTLLLRRWLIYYAVLPSIIRLVAFQSICWTLVRISLYLFGPEQPIGGWLLVSSFTAAVDVVARWITSNITDLDDTEHDAHAHSDYPDTGASDGEGLYSANESGASTMPSQASLAHQQRIRRYREQSARLFRVLVGGASDEENTLSDSDLSDTDSKPELSGQRGDLARRRRLLDPNAPVTSDSDALSPAPYAMDAALWRLRVDARRSRAHRSRTQRLRQRRKAKQSQISSFFQNYRAARIHSRRVFHWEVAMWRNVMPIALLGYLSLWVLILAWFSQSHSTDSL